MRATIKGRHYTIGCSTVGYPVEGDKPIALVVDHHGVYTTTICLTVENAQHLRNAIELALEEVEQAALVENHSRAG